MRSFLYELTSYIGCRHSANNNMCTSKWVYSSPREDSGLCTFSLFVEFLSHTASQTYDISKCSPIFSDTNDNMSGDSHVTQTVTWFSVGMAFPQTC